MVKTKIIECSEGMSAKDKVRMLSVNSAEKMEAVVGETITVTGWAHLEVTNDQLNDPVYDRYVFCTDTGKKYFTSSPTFWDSFRAISDALSDLGESTEKIEIIVLSKPSKNQSGVYYTCDLV